MEDRDRKQRGGGHKRRGKNNGRHTKPEATCRGEAWHEAHDKPAVRRKKSESRKRYLRENPETIRGSNNPRSKLTEADVRKIRTLLAAGVTTQKAIGERFGVSKTVVGHIKRGKLWSHVQ